MSALTLLAIETSSAAGSVALAVGDSGGHGIDERAIATPREQAERVLVLVDELLAAAGLELSRLDALVFGRGPGSFTGVRLAAAVVQGLALASNRPIVAVSSLAALAQRGLTVPLTALTVPGVGLLDSRRAAGPDTGPPDSRGGARVERALCCVDARMGEVYSASFRLVDGLARPESDEVIGRPGAVVPPPAPYVALGDAFGAYAEALAGVGNAAARVRPDLVPRARDLLPRAAAEVGAGRFVPPSSALPVYLREADAWRRSP